MTPPLEISIDLSFAQARAAETIQRLNKLCDRYDLAPFEYTNQVRIAPNSLPHSHPILTLNTRPDSEEELLGIYLHEQMHWYVTWFSRKAPQDWNALLRELNQLYPEVPIGGSDGARDEHSTYLHLIVNHLEVEATCRLLPRDQVEQRVRQLHFYRWIYGTVLKDFDQLAGLFSRYGLVPLKPATEFSEMDFRLAASPAGND